MPICCVCTVRSRADVGTALRHSVGVNTAARPARTQHGECSGVCSGLAACWLLPLPAPASCRQRGHSCRLASRRLCRSLLALRFLVCVHSRDFLRIGCLFWSPNFFCMWLNETCCRTSNTIPLVFTMLSSTQVWRGRFSFLIGRDLIMFFPSHTHTKRFSVTNNFV